MSATITISEASELLGISRNTAYARAAEDGHLAGVKVITVGRRKVLPRAPLYEILGLPDKDSGSGTKPEPLSHKSKGTIDNARPQG